MVRVLRLLLLLMFAMGMPLHAQQGGGNAYAVDGIDVDVVSRDIESARMAAYRIAQRKAWPMLWARLTGSAEASAPRLSDGQLDSMVSGIESQGERFSTTRYIARLGVIFDRQRAREYLGDSASTLQSPPMLLMPVFSDGGVRTLYQSKTPWVEAWQRFRENVTPIDYVVASGSAGDNLLLTNWQAQRPDRASWRNILNRFDAVDVLIAEARLMRAWPGGPVTGLFIARHGPDATELARFRLRAADDAGIPAMLDAAVRQIDAAYGNALRNGALRSEPDLTLEMAPLLAPAPLIGSPVTENIGAGVDAQVSSLEVLVPTPDANAVSTMEAALRETPGVTAVTITSMSLGGTTRMIVNHAGTRESLVLALDAQGLQLASENGEMVLRRRREGAPPLQRSTAAPLAGVPAIAPPAVAGVSPGAASAPPARRPGTPAAPQPGRPQQQARPAVRPGAAPVDLLPRAGVPPKPAPAPVPPRPGAAA